jgi:hypothetical protein
MVVHARLRRYGENMIVMVWSSISSIAIVCYLVFGGDILVQTCPSGDIMVVVVCCVCVFTR